LKGRILENGSLVYNNGNSEIIIILIIIMVTTLFIVANTFGNKTNFWYGSHRKRNVSTL